MAQKDPNTWMERRTKRLLVISATQIEVFNQCKRKWWLEQVRSLPVPPTGSQVFGTVTHQVAERFLTADDLGRDPNTGRAVELFPEGWHVAQPRYPGEPSEGSASPVEQGIIKALIPAAIENGVLQRLPGRKVEQGFRLDVAFLKCPQCGGGGLVVSDSPTSLSEKCPACDGDGRGTHVQLMGFIDLHHAPVEANIQDHKTTSNMRYAKSPKALSENAQMLIYAKAIDQIYAAEHLPAPETFTLRHNVYCKDPDAPAVRKVEVIVRREVVEEHWQRVQASAAEMDRFRRTAEKWSDLPDPTDSHACNAYGGCPFQAICGGQESELGYQQRLERYLAEKAQQQQQKLSPAASVSLPVVGNSSGAAGPAGDSSMSIFAKLGISGGTTATPAAPPPPPPINPPVPPAVAGNMPGQIADRGNGEGRQTVHPNPAAQAAADVQALAPAPPPPPPALPPQPAPANGEALVNPPWHNPGCAACVNVPGFNSKGNPCRICDTEMSKAGKPTSDKFVISPAGDGTCVWLLKDNDEVTGRSAMTMQARNGGQAPVKAQEKAPVQAPVAPPPPAPAAPVQAPVQAPPPPAVQVTPAAPVQAPPPPVTPAAPVQAPAEEPAETEAKSGRGRPKKGFVLLMGCAPITGIQKTGSGRGSIMLSHVLAQYGQQCLDDYKAKTGRQVESFYEIDAFARRDWLCAMVGKMVEGFTTDFVVADGDGPDMKALVNAILPYAGMVVVPIKQ